MSRRARAVPQAPLLWLVPPPPPRPVKVGKPKRAVLLVPPARAARHVDACASYCLRQHLDVVAIAADAGDALRALTLDRADILVAISSRDLLPLIQLMTDERGDEDDPELRRPGDGQRRVRRTYRI